MIWLLFGLMLLAAALFVAWPLYRRERRLSASLVAGVGTVMVLSAGVYSFTGTPVEPPAPSVDAMMSSLEQRLAEQPDDLDGWKMLGRSAIHLEDWPKAVTAFERAVELESATNAQTLADLGEAMLNNDWNTITGRAGDLFENAIVISPTNHKALFYAGVAAVERGNLELGAERWEALLAQSPPPEVQAILRERIAVWRGEEPAATPAVATGEAVIEVDLSLSADASEAVGPDATVYIIARDPAQPSPPVAAVRRKASELPLTVTLGDGDSMIPGRLLSSFRQLEIVARASISGEPLARAGDWYGQETIDPGAGGIADAVRIHIEQRVQ
jgi:cytochrome c-type biogenesis protein CcmH